MSVWNQIIETRERHDSPSTVFGPPEDPPEDGEDSELMGVKAALERLENAERVTEEIGAMK